MHILAAMRIGVPKEIKIQEYRVGLVPAAVRELTAAGTNPTRHSWILISFGTPMRMTVSYR